MGLGLGLELELRLLNIECGRCASGALDLSEAEALSAAAAAGGAGVRRGCAQQNVESSKALRVRSEAERPDDSAATQHRRT